MLKSINNNMKTKYSKNYNFINIRKIDKSSVQKGSNATF